MVIFVSGKWLAGAYVRTHDDDDVAQHYWRPYWSTVSLPFKAPFPLKGNGHDDDDWSTYELHTSMHFMVN